MVIRSLRFPNGCSFVMLRSDLGPARGPQLLSRSVLHTPLKKRSDCYGATNISVQLEALV